MKPIEQTTTPSKTRKTRKKKSIVHITAVFVKNSQNWQHYSAKTDQGIVNVYVGDPGGPMPDQVTVKLVHP